jgi:hypothetical protein
MLKVRIEHHSDLYKLQWWLYENVGEKGSDWWITPLKARNEYPWIYELDLHILNEAKEMFCHLGTTGRYFEVWNSQEISQPL